MKIIHVSDTHNNPGMVKSVGNIAGDVILLTGDIISNKGRVPVIAGAWGSGGSSYRINPVMERNYQRTWFRHHAKKWAPAFGNRPVIYVDGNHDFIDIAGWLIHYGVPSKNLFHITEANPCVTVFDKKFAGFRDIPRIDDEWMNETQDFTVQVDRTFECDPDILVTHAPPAGILDGNDGYGIPELTAALTYRPHRITHHFFGHEHSCGGQVVKEMGIKFANGACHVTTHEVP